MPAPVDTGNERVADRALALTHDVLGATARLMQRIHTAAHERRIIHEARRGALGAQRDGDYIRPHADRLRRS